MHEQVQIIAYRPGSSFLFDVLASSLGLQRWRVYPGSTQGAVPQGNLPDKLSGVTASVEQACDIHVAFLPCRCGHIGMISLGTIPHALAMIVW